MDARAVETGLARFTLAGLVVYVPVETWVSLPGGLWHPFYLVDFVAMVLLFWGARHSLRSRPDGAPARLCVAWAWAACNGWRGTWWRVLAIGRGEPLDYGIAEAWAVGIASSIALACFLVSVFLLTRDPSGSR